MTVTMFWLSLGILTLIFPDHTAHLFIPCIVVK